MNFAVIEYGSKSGKVWQHTDDKPNYLADSHAEMDPTSFGCYVSALKGRHIPITQLAGSHRLVNRLYRKAVGRWPRNYSLQTLDDLDAVIVVHDIANGLEVTAFTKKLKGVYPEIIVLGVPTQPFGILKRHWETNKAWLDDFKVFMNNCDVFISIVESTVPAWKILTKTNVQYLPQPYPVEFAGRYFKELGDKKDVLFVAGVTDRDNIKQGQAAARKVQEMMPNYLIQATRTTGSTNDFTHLAGTRYEIIDFLPWQEQLEYLSRVKAVINTDYTQTRGRVQADCAAVGTVSIGADSDGQRDLYPSLYTATPQTTEVLANRTAELLRDGEKYTQTAKLAQNRLAEYDYEKSACRLTKLVDEISRRKKIT